MTDFELGYTPRNLKIIRKKYGLTITDVANITNTSLARTVQKWEAENLDMANHADMPLKKWVKLLAEVSRQHHEAKFK